MILQNLNLRFYKQYVHLNLDFKEGLACIVGRNGAGKSTLFNAILYALFGKEDGSKEHIRTAHSSHQIPVEVRLSFLLGNKLYRIERMLRGKRGDTHAMLYHNDALIANGATTVNEQIQKLLGLDATGFRNTAFAAQKELDALSRTGGESRKKMIRQMLGLEKLDDIQNLVRQDARDINNQIKGQKEALLPENETEEIKRQIAELNELAQKQDLTIAREQVEYDSLNALDAKIKRRFDAENMRKDRHFKAISEREAANSRLKTLDDEYKRLQNQKANLAQREQIHLQNKPDYAELQKLRDAIREQDEQQERRQKTRELAARIEDQKKAIAAQTELILRIGIELDAENDNELLMARLEEEMADLERRLSEANTAIQRNREDAKVITERMKTRKKRVKDLRESGKDGECPTCLRPLLDAYDRVMADLMAEIEHAQHVELRDLDAEHRELELRAQAFKSDSDRLRHERENARIRQTQLLAKRQRLDEEKRRSAELDQQLERLLAQLQAIGPGAEMYDAERHNNLKSQYEHAVKIAAAWENEEKTLRRDIPAIEKNLSENAENRRQTEALLNTINNSIAEIAFDMHTFDAVNQERSAFAQRLGSQAKALSEAREKGKGMRREAEKLQDKLDRNQQLLNQIQEKNQEYAALRHLETCVKSFKDETLARTGPAISQEAGTLFQRITEGKYEGIRVDENFDFWIYDGGAPFPVTRFSGGETDLACFCLRIAVTKAIAGLAGSEQHLGFLGFDEIFGSQDEIRRENILAALQLLKEQFRQIYVVTHIESVRDAFQHILEVRQGEKGSRAVWSS